jgi:hypothetical protein
MPSSVDQRGSARRIAPARIVLARHRQADDDAQRGLRAGGSGAVAGESAGISTPAWLCEVPCARGTSRIASCLNATSRATLKNSWTRRDAPVGPSFFSSAAMPRKMPCRT